MSRPMLVVFVFLMLVITSQFEWRQQLVNDAYASPGVSHNQRRISKRDEAVKEKIILSQEKNIQRLNELVQSLRKQLLQCWSNNESRNGAVSSLTKNIVDLERQTILED